MLYLTCDLTDERIQAQNTLHTEANLIEEQLLRILSPYQGSKVWKISGYGGAITKLKGQLEQYYSDHNYNQPDQPYWLNVHSSYNSLLANLRHRNAALSLDIYLARFDETTGNLTKLCEGQKRRTDFMLAEVKQSLAEARELEEKANKLRSSISVFARR
jgi:hypothetical protein